MTPLILGFAGSRADLEARAAKAAAAGSEPARYLLACLRNTPAPRRQLTQTIFASWRCPVCGGGARSASGKHFTVRCVSGHVRDVDGKFSLKALLARGR